MLAPLDPLELESSLASGSMERSNSTSSRDAPMPSPTLSAPSSPRSPVRGVPLHGSPQPSLVHKRSNLHISSTFDSPPSASTSTVPAPPSPSTQVSNLSISRPRRSSLLMHEIQPPARRLSAHQVLLLTPFGGASPPVSPAPIYAESSSGMSRSPSFIKHALPPLSAPLLREGSSWPRPPTRPRHMSLQAGSSVPSMVGSEPMTTIPSTSDTSGGSNSAAATRQHSREKPDDESPKSPAETVAMTRSNSLPVLTLRELEALKEKDEELGINRGGSWAWVSRPRDDDDGSISASFADSSKSASTSAVSMDAITPPAVPWAFADPFAPREPALSTSAGRSPRHIAVGREIAPFTHQYQPISTAESYHYSPIWNDRRMSETPSLLSLTSGQHGSGYTSPATSSRRPSAPAVHFNSVVPQMSPLQATPRASKPVAESSKVPDAEAPPVSSVRSSFSSGASRPRLMRYKTSPSQRNGLGLEIVVAPTPIRGQSPAQRPGDSRRQSEASATSSGGDSVPRRSRPTSIRGGWAPIEVLDPLELDLEAELPGHRSGSISSASSKRTSISIARSASPNVIVFGKPFPLVDEFGKSLEVGRGRFDSVDSAIPRQAIDMYAARRGGSLAVLDSNKAMRRSWHDPAVVTGGWQERRGSWAEGWERS